MFSYLYTSLVGALIVSHLSFTSVKDKYSHNLRVMCIHLSRLIRLDNIFTFKDYREDFKLVLKEYKHGYLSWLLKLELNSYAFLNNL